MTYPSTKATDAADRIEELLIAGKQIVQDIREVDTRFASGHNRRAYARAYWLRRELSRVVATLGEGVPPRLERVAKYYEAQIK